MSTFYTADLHLGHKRILELCKTRSEFSDVDEMNEEIVSRFNQMVQPEDDLWLLGDICMGKLTDSLEVLSRINGRKILVPGNHDRVSPAYHHTGNRAEKVQRFADMYLEVVDEIIWKNPWEHRIDKRDVLLSHFPYVGDSHDEARYAELRPKYTGLPLIHGHVHEEWRWNGRMVNVGVDVWDMAPVPEEELTEWVWRWSVLPNRLIGSERDD